MNQAMRGMCCAVGLGIVGQTVWHVGVSANPTVFAIALTADSCAACLGQYGRFSSSLLPLAILCPSWLLRRPSLSPGWSWKLEELTLLQSGSRSILPTPSTCREHRARLILVTCLCTSDRPCPSERQDGLRLGSASISKQPGLSFRYLLLCRIT